MARRVARRRDQSHFIRKPVVHLHQIHQTGIEDWLNRVRQDLLLFRVALGAPMGMLRATDQIPSLGKGRHPLAVHQHGVPAHMVHMQVGADHGVDAIAGPACLTEPREKLRRQSLPAVQAARLVIADAGINHEAQTRCLHQQRVDREPQMALLRHVVWIEPVVPSQRFWRGVRQERAARAIGHRQFDFDNAGDLNVTDLPTEHRATPYRNDAFNFAKAADPGINCASLSIFSGALTVSSDSCRSLASGST